MSAEVIRIARTWLGTPYHHQASLKGVGTDCLGLIRGVWRELYGEDAPVPPNYSRDWAEASGIETMLEAAHLHLLPVERDAQEPGRTQAGDVLIFRVRDFAVAKHAGIATSALTFVHAMEGCPVSEVALSPWWRRRIAGVFRFVGR